MPQFDNESRQSLYGTYTDNIIAGSSSINPERPWTRGVYGSVSSGSSEFQQTTKLSEYQLQTVYPFYKSGTARFLRLQSVGQVLEDSIMPSIPSLVLTGTYGSGKIGLPGIYPGYTDELAMANIILLSSPGETNALTSSVGGLRVNNIEWCYSSPFEKKFYAVPKFDTWPYPITFGPLQNSPPVDEPLWKDSSGVTDVKKYNLIFIRQPELLGTKYYDSFIERSGSGGVFGAPNFPTAVTSDTPLLAAKVFFGVEPTAISAGTVILGMGSVYTQCSGAIIRGWKYGVANGVPTKFSCVFRRDRYGQPRDMLEGRPYTKTYANPEIGGPFDEGGGIRFVSGSALAGESDNWLTASIYSSNDVAAAYRANPYGSGLFDKEYRSALPWFDNDPRRAGR